MPKYENILRPYMEAPLHKHQNADLNEENSPGIARQFLKGKKMASNVPVSVHTRRTAGFWQKHRPTAATVAETR